MWRYPLLLMAASWALSCNETTSSTSPAVDAVDVAETAGDSVVDTAADVPSDASPDAADVAADVVQDVVPDVAQDIAQDATADGWQPGVACGAGANGKTCPSGQICYVAPCPKCGTQPPGTCAPALPAQGCYDYTHCAVGACIAGKPQEGISGFCLPLPSAGACWPDASTSLPACYPGSTCEGASLCAPKDACSQPSKPGACKPDAAHTGKVILWARNGSPVAPGEIVTVTWINGSAASVFLPGCTTYEIETSQGSGAWKNLGPPAVCAWEGYAVEVKPGGYFDTMPWPTPAKVNGANYRFTGTYSTGCQPGKPLSQSACTGSASVVSEVFSVGLAP